MRSKLAAKLFRAEVELEVMCDIEGRWFIGFNHMGIVVKESLFFFKTRAYAEEQLSRGFIPDQDPLSTVGRRVPFRVVEVI